jgi:CHAT domain-containing protein
VFNRLPGLQVWRGLGGPADAAESLSTLGSPVPLLVEFVVTDDDLLAVVVRESDGKLETGAVVAPVESRLLTQRITQALDPVALRSSETWRDAGGEIVKLLPAAAWIAMASASRVLIAPDDVLWHVPFEALPFEAGVLGDRTVVRYISSATALLPATDAATRSGTGPLLAVASPELTASARDRMSATAPDWSLPADTASESEARAVAAALGSPADAVIAGGAATEEGFRERAPGAAIIHVAAPFRVNSASPLFSPLLLGGDANAAAPDRDGTLEARELFDLELHARAAVFTDGAALSMRAAAPALDTVRWAWRAAGVSSIVVPRWRGDPTATTMFLEEFYKQVKEGAAVDDALQHARATVRAKEEMRAPFYWAEWMLVGTPEKTERTGKSEKD